MGAHAQPFDIVTDPLTAAAIDGYDPVSYFIAPEPQQGKPDFEYVWGGVSWYFASAANRDVFARSPEAYAPQFGGHCVTSLARGYLSDGKPRLFVIEALKLYFFYSTANRDAFMLSKSPTVAKAVENWTNLSNGLPISSSQPPSSEAPVEPPQDAAPVAPDHAAANVQAH